MTNLFQGFDFQAHEQFVVNPLKQRIVQEPDGTVKHLSSCQMACWLRQYSCVNTYGLSVCVTTQVGCNIEGTFWSIRFTKKQRDLNNGKFAAQIMLVQKYFDERGQDERVSLSLSWEFQNHLQLQQSFFEFCSYPSMMTKDGYRCSPRITVSTLRFGLCTRDFTMS